MQPIATAVREAQIWLSRTVESRVAAKSEVERAMALLLPTIGETAEAWDTPPAQAYIALERAKALLGGGD